MNPELAPDRWSRLSPWLDELLDLPAPERQARLDELAQQDAGLAAELVALLAHLPGIEHRAFLETQALPSTQGLAADEPPPQWAGHRWGAYQLLKEIGRGGMGSVWLAERTDGRYEGQVAIKLLRGGWLGRGETDRFTREGRILARLAHPHIARLLDAGVSPDGTVPYMVLEYVQGQPIDQHCTQAHLDLPARLALFLDVLDAVAHAHNRLILHRDLKPSNILVSAEGQIKLLDFGVAKLLDTEPTTSATELTREMGQAYTLLYAAPEQLQGGDVSTATDVYALGVLLHLLLTGQHPLAGMPQARLMHTVLDAEMPAPSDVLRRQGGPGARRLARELTGDLDTIVAKALKKRPQDRYANAADMAADLRRHLAHAPITARPDTWVYRSTRFLRRHTLAVAASGLVAVALLGTAGWAMYEAERASAQRRQAEGLIEFMLGDLRKKLQPVGRLDVLDTVGDQALAYYAGQPPSALDADAQGRRARALHLLGEIAEQRGQLDAAALRFRQAADSTAALLAAAPGDGQRVFDQAQSEYWLGFIDWRRGRLTEAEAAFQRYLTLATQLVRMDGRREDWRIEQAYARHNLGVLYIDMTRGAQAVAAFEATLSVWNGLTQPGADVLLSKADAQGWLAVAQESVGALDDAVTTLQAKLTTLAQVRRAASAPNRQADYLDAEAQHEISRLRLALGQPALNQATVAVAAFATLVQRDPANLNWQAGAAFAQLGLAEVQLALQRPDDARRTLRSVGPVVAQLLATDANKAYWQIQLQGRWRLLQVLAATPPQRQAALQDLEAYLRQARAWQRDGHSPDRQQRVVLSRAALVAGDGLAARGQASAAQAEWQTVPPLLQPLVLQGDPAALALLAHVRLRLGEQAQAQALASQIQSTTPYRSPLYADLLMRLDATRGTPGPTALAAKSPNP